jgi:hypothetical protein
MCLLCLKIVKNGASSEGAVIGQWPTIDEAVSKYLIRNLASYESRPDRVQQARPSRLTSRLSTTRLGPYHAGKKPEMLTKCSNQIPLHDPTFDAPQSSVTLQPPPIPLHTPSPSPRLPLRRPRCPPVGGHFSPASLSVVKHNCMRRL